MPVIAFALLSNFAQAGVIEMGIGSTLMPPVPQATAATPQRLAAGSLVVDLGERVVARSSQITHQELVARGVRALTPRPGNVRSALRSVSSDKVILTHRAARR
jgi:hypothetical protein